jgi:hypothetical protein
MRRLLKRAMNVLNRSTPRDPSLVDDIRAVLTRTATMEER